MALMFWQFREQQPSTKQIRTKLPWFCSHRGVVDAKGHCFLIGQIQQHSSF
jgi:hypothetical protein